MKKQMTILAAAAILGAFASAAVAAVPTLNMVGGLYYYAEYNMLDRASPWLDPADGLINNGAISVNLAVATSGNPNLGTISLWNTLGVAYGTAISGTVKGANVSLGSVAADWDGMSANTWNPGASISKTIGNTTFTAATTGAKIAGSAAVAAAPGAYLVGSSVMPYAAGDTVPTGAVVLVAPVAAKAAVADSWDIVNAGKVAVTLGNASLYGALVVDPAWAGLGYVGASSKVGTATVAAKAGKLLGSAGDAAAFWAQADIPVTPNLKVTAKAAVAPADYKYAHLDADSYQTTNFGSTGVKTLNDWVDMDYLGYVASQADRNNGKLNVYAKANLTVDANIAPYAAVDYRANGDYLIKAGTSYKSLYVNDAYIALSDSDPALPLGEGHYTEFFAGFGKGIVSASVGYKVPTGAGDAQTSAEVRVTKPIDWVTTWAALGKAYTSSKPYLKVGATASIGF